MDTKQMEELREEALRFKSEQDRIRQIVGQIGGKGYKRRERVVTIAFMILLGLLFLADVCRHLLGIHVPLPPLFSIEIGILLVSIKVIWMIRNQTRVEHFQFWILNSIEFRIDEMSNRIRDIEKKLSS
jgi:hypothetical protein